MIDRAKVARALEIAERFGNCTITIQRGVSSSGAETTINILVYGFLNPDQVERALEMVPRLEKYRGNTFGDIWATAMIDGIRLKLTGVGQCRAVEKTVQVSEMVATGKMLEETITHYICPEDVQ